MVSTKRASAELDPTNRDDLTRLLAWLLPDPGIFSSLSLHGNTKWLPCHLVVLAVLWSWSDARCVTDAYQQAFDQCRSLLAAPLPTTYQGFLGALLTWSSRLLPLARQALRQRMQQLGGPLWRVHGWVPLAFDGSRCSAPRTGSNEAALSAPNHGKGKTARYRRKKSKGMRRRRNRDNPAQPPRPQAWLTLLWHMGLRLPWSWRLGPSNASERGHALGMAQDESFPADTLFVGDAGFVGYDFWAGLLAAGHQFLVRVGSNVHLLTRTANITWQRQGKHSIVLCWPGQAITAGKPPLTLRLFRVRLGNAKVWLLTSVLGRQRLTTRQAERFYRMRWGVEVEFRHLKQTMGRAELRCRQADRLLVELEWALFGLAAAELLATKEQLTQGGEPASSPRPEDPGRRSLAAALRALRRGLRQLGDAASVAQRLREAVTDGYRRHGSKRARYRRANPDKKPLGDPNVQPLTPDHHRKLKQAMTIPTS